VLDLLRSCLSYVPYHFRSLGLPQTTEVIPPRLHHGASLGETLRSVVGSSHFVALRMGKLQFDQIRMPSLLI
jgi:hypothetical protein